ncbi:hypothetical protein CK203_064509 [Vitis vinifera]|uniref:Uncharacterized protein n=1 Tax=Vitis vinifera TaxID=29760 RepID=A0A438G7P2_VITVI|nr:hypothetical protein CK203_064509 [Vitis vinifera]
MGRIPEWPPQDSNPSPRLKDDKVALLVPSVLVAQMDSNPSPRLKDDKVALLVPSALRPICLFGPGQPHGPDTRVASQDSNPSPRLKDDKVALLVPSVLGSNPGEATLVSGPCG